MSVVVVKIKKKENTSLLKKLVAALNEKADVLTDEEFRDMRFSVLMEAGRKSKLLSANEAKNELKKRGVAF
ncbi:MAG: hypothetical protein JST43_10715 [Bacteroidetes bacterium]|nr:hypothetical protein [Bacteroidota bacterium]MBS1540146.1 hypothetical protein [Bacteroidota bacterium]